MSFDVVTYSAIEELGRRAVRYRTVHYFFWSGIWTAPVNCTVNVRALGAGGLASSTSYDVHGNGGTVAITRVRLRKGQQITVTIGSGEHAGATTAVCAEAGLNLLVPAGATGATRGSGTTNAQNPQPTGADIVYLPHPATQGERGVAPVVLGVPATNANDFLMSLWMTPETVSESSLTMLAKGYSDPNWWQEQPKQNLYPHSYRPLFGLGGAGRYVDNARQTQHRVGRGGGGFSALGNYSTVVVAHPGDGMVTLEIFEEE